MFPLGDRQGDFCVGGVRTQWQKSNDLAEQTILEYMRNSKRYRSG